MSRVNQRPRSVFVGSSLSQNEVLLPDLTPRAKLRLLLSAHWARFLSVLSTPPPWFSVVPSFVSLSHFCLKGQSLIHPRRSAMVHELINTSSLPASLGSPGFLCSGLALSPSFWSTFILPPPSPPFNQYLLSTY